MADDDAATRKLEQSFGTTASAGAGAGGPASGVLPAGARVGRFLIVRLVGEGGLGRVYLAFDPELDRKVAIKLLKLRALTAEDHSEGRDALLREAQTMARLAHPNVVTIYDVGVHDGDVFLAMEYVLGDSMRAWLAKAPRRWPDVLRVFLAAGRGLAAAHAAGIVHRDFKPDNVIVDPEGRARVLDFGLALARDDPPDAPDGAAPEPAADATTQRRFVGTPAYMAPEQLMCRPTDARGDQFSFCVALYEAAHGVRPFAGRKVSEVLFAIHGAQLQAPARAGAPGWLRPVLQRGLAADPADRFPDMEALLAELARDRWAPVRLGARVLGGALALAGLGLAIHTWRLPGELRVAITDLDGAPLAGVVHVGDRLLAADEAGAGGPVPPGRYELTVAAPDHIAEHRVVEVLRGARVDLEVALRHEEGTFDLEVQPAGGTVLIDGEDFGSRLRRLPVATGDHDVLARRLGHHDARLRWPLRAGQRRSGFVYLPQAVAWSRAATGINDMPQTLGDVDGDGQLEILHSNFGTLTATDPRRDRNVWRLALPGRAADVAATGDLDGDGLLDVAALVPRADGTATLQAWSGARPPDDQTEPRSLWQTEAPRPLVSGDTGTPPIVRDLDGDGAGDVLAPLFPDGDLSAWHGRSGAPLWRWAAPAPLHNVVVGAGADGPRVFIATRGGLHLVDGRTGASAWTRGLDGDLARALQDQTRAAPPRVPTLIARPLDDVAGDDLLVLVGGVADLYLFALAGADGRLLWRRDAEGLEWDLWPGVDVTGDGVVDFPISTERVDVAGTRHIELLDGASGRALWRTPTDGGGQLGALAWPGGPAIVHEGRTDGLRLRAATDGALLRDLELDSDPSVPPLLVDWDSDGADDLVVATRRGTVIAFDRDGRIAGSALVRRPVSRLGPAGDVNGDGFPDLLVLGAGPSLLRGSAVLWQREGEDAVRARPLVADLDADGRPELVAVGDFGGDGRAVHVFDAATGAERFATPVGDAIREPALVPADGGLDILVHDAHGLLLVDGRTGRAGEHVETAQSYASPLVADLDRDGQLEVVSLPWYLKDPLTLYGLGERVPRHRRPLPGDGGWARPLAADLDGDGRDELLVVTHQGTVAAIDADLGQVRGTFELGGRVVHPPWVGDLDGDGALEVISGSAAGELVCLRGPGLKPQWGLLGLGALNSQPAVEPREGLIFTASASEGAVAVRADGTIVWHHRPEPGAALQPEPAAPFVLADLEHDGAPELLATFADGSLRVLDAATGAPQWQFRSAGGTIEAAPTAADVDGDGVDEVVVGSHDRHLYVLRTPHRSAR